MAATTSVSSFFAPAVMTPEALRKICKDTGGYSQPHLNDHLLLQCKGFTAIANLDEYVGLRCLWLQENAISKIEGLDNLKDLRTLYLHQNCISRIENLGGCSLLNTVNLSNNWITTIENLSSLRHLETLIISHCRLASLSSIRHVWEIPSLQVVDLSNNKLDIEGSETPEVFIEFWTHMPNLAVLYVHGNEVVNRIRHYRKKMVSQLPRLTYLDERPIFDEERRVAKAWAVGGHEAESSERSLIAEEKAAELKRDIQRWKDIQSKGKDAKVVREREWLVHMEQKKVDDEATRQRRKEQQDEMMQSEQQGRDSVEVEAYRSETSLLQVARDLRCLHARHTRERGDLTVVEGAARRQVNLMEGEDFETIGTALESLLAGRKPESGEKFLVSLSRDSELASWMDETQQQQQQQQGDGVIITELGKRMTPQQRVRQILLDAARGEDEMPVLVAEEVEVDKNEVVCCSSSSSISSLKTKSKPKPKTEDIWKMYLSWERRSAMS